MTPTLFHAWKCGVDVDLGRVAAQSDQSYMTCDVGQGLIDAIPRK